MAMTLPVPLTLPSRQDEVFPRLTPDQIARVAAHGRTRSVVAGEVLVEGGQPVNSFFVVTEGQLDVVLVSGDKEQGAKEQLVTSHQAGQFSGEINLLAGRPGLATIRAAGPGRVVELDRESFLELVQTDGE